MHFHILWLGGKNHQTSSVGLMHFPRMKQLSMMAWSHHTTLSHNWFSPIKEAWELRLKLDEVRGINFFFCFRVCRCLQTFLIIFTVHLQTVVSAMKLGWSNWDGPYVGCLQCFLWIFFESYSFTLMLLQVPYGLCKATRLVELSDRFWVLRLTFESDTLVREMCRICTLSLLFYLFLMLIINGWKIKVQISQIFLLNYELGILE